MKLTSVSSARAKNRSGPSARVNRAGRGQSDQYPPPLRYDLRPFQDSELPCKVGLRAEGSRGEHFKRDAGRARLQDKESRMDRGQQVGWIDIGGSLEVDTSAPCLRNDVPDVQGSPLKE